MPGVWERRRTLSSPHPLRGFGGRQNTKSCVFLASSIAPGGINEKQTTTISGSPSGGTFTLTFRGATTAGIAYNAAAAAVETALEALSTIGVGQVNVTGAGPYVVEFTGDLGRQDLPLMTASGASLTGGTTPSVAVAQTVQGSNVDAGRFQVRRGMIIKVSSTDNTKVEIYNNSGTILGVLAEDKEFLTRDDLSNTDLSYWGGPNCDFLTKNVRGSDGTYATYATNFETWAAANGCVVTKGAI
jgi:hypothetical protein